jgi:hypothetical protein
MLRTNSTAFVFKKGVQRTEAESSMTMGFRISM